MALQVIGAGFPRTGTLSQKLALERLGFGPCHHMTEVFANPGSWPLWDRLGDGEPVDWDQVFDGYWSTTDAPGCWFYAELAERYPGAKVILSERDPDRWYESVSATILADAHREGMSSSPIGAIIRKLASRGMFGASTADSWESGPPDRARMIELFLAHNAAVRRAIPAERLLVFQARDGWAPLCAFLGVPVPDEPFPHVNNAEEFRAIQIPA
jgi:hypothetical protein